MEINLVVYVLRIALVVALWGFVLLSLKGLRADLLRAGQSQSTSVVGRGWFSRRKHAGTQVPTKLVIIEGPGTGYELKLTGITSLTIGRGKECGLRLQDDYASTTHARLFVATGSIWVEDLASRNGTYVNGQRIDAPEQILPNTTITIGRTTVRLEA